MRHVNNILWTAAAAVALGSGSMTVTPAVAKDYYAGKSITLLVGFGAQWEVRHALFASGTSLFTPNTIL